MNTSNSKRMFWGGYCELLIVITAVFFAITVSALKYRPDEVNYRNADATWHTLLTIKAYDETPASDHLFLPIVSLGGDDNKFIPWGATIPDKNGNYYYTSFSPAGYFAPWLFMKVFRLETCEKSLYIFNSVLLVLSTSLWGIFIFWIFGAEKDKVFLALIGIVTYVLTPELMHGMGIVYWHQSLMQVTFPAQLMAFLRTKKTQSRLAKVIFYVLTFMNPCIEWTGYVANIGFALAEMILGYQKKQKKGFVKATFLGVLTICSFGCFAGHYLLRVDFTSFFSVLIARFSVRNISIPIRFTTLFGSYLASFLYLWILLLILVIWNIAKKQSVECKHGMLLMLLAFPVIENVIMKQHALEYTYDKMKAGFLLSFWICELTHQLLVNCENKKMTASMISVSVMITGVLNFNSYVHDPEYIWSTSYQEENKKIATYINENYADSVLGIKKLPIRGYMNLLFGRGIYEGTNAEFLKNQAVERGKRYAIILDVEDPNAWNVYDLDGATVYDMQTGGELKLLAKNDEIATIDLLATRVKYQLSSLTDENWTVGYSNTTNTLLFEYNEYLLADLQRSKYVICEGSFFSIESIDYDNLWIRVTVGTDAAICQYPHYMQLE